VLYRSQWSLMNPHSGMDGHDNNDNNNNRRTKAIAAIPMAAIIVAAALLSGLITFTDSRATNRPWHSKT
jgi:hypothetical protein